MLRPDKNTPNAIIEQLSISAPNDIAFRPHIYLDLSGKPREYAVIDRQRNIDYWKSDARNYPPTQPEPIRKYILFRDYVLFFAADLARASDSFGWAATLFDNLGLLMRHAIVDSPAVPISCDQHLHVTLATLARGRTPSIDYFSLLIEERYGVRRYAAAPSPEGESKKATHGEESLSKDSSWG